MRKLYEIFKVLKIQKRIVSPETICGNTVVSPILFTEFVKKGETIQGNTVLRYLQSHPSVLQVSALR